MISMKFGRNKNFYFDTELVRRAMDKATHKALSKGGAFVMRGARKSIKNGEVKARGRVNEGEKRRVIERRVSQPGQPPYSQTGFLRDNIEFAADLSVPGSPSVVIGPERLLKSSGAQSTLEFGGTVNNKAELPVQFRIGDHGPIRADGYRRIRAVLHTAKQVERAQRIFEATRKKKRTVKVAARPYMGPALEREAPKLPAQFRNSMVRSV